jgi:uncharacterized protein (DUF924 family)
MRVPDPVVENWKYAASGPGAGPRSLGIRTAPYGVARTRYHGAMYEIADVLGFWFGEPGSPERGRPRKCWFEKSEAFDAEVRYRFLALQRRAAAGKLRKWERTPLAALALVVLLDQFPRNMFRGEARAFACDALALRVARHIVDSRFDSMLRPVERWFAYLPFEHAEDLAVQRRSLTLFGALAGDPDSAGTISYARRHYDIVRRFGRFPHRNAILGRVSTSEEAAFLSQPGSSF